jgi:glycerol-3-phosphate dehydrogenase subunit B
MRGRMAREAIVADVIVIGGGIAGAAAALAARREGRTVALVRRAWGATALSGGTLDLAPDPLASANAPLGERRDVLACIRALALRRPDHPWAMLQDRLGEIPAALAAATEESGGRLAFGALDAENRCLLTPLGTLKATAGGQDGVLAGDLLRGGRIGVVGFARHPGWDADLLAAALEELAARSSLRCSAHAVACDTLDRIEDFSLHPHQLAAKIEADPDRFAQSIRRALPPGVDRLLLPPLLGVGDPRPLLGMLENVLQLPCAELPATSTAPLPGLRLQHLLEARLEEQGVALWHGEAFAPDGTPGSLQVRVPTPQILDASRFDEGRAAVQHDAPPSWRASAGAVILATGRYVGGGIHRAGRLRETVFDLPVAVGGERDTGSWIGSITTQAHAGDQPAFAAGIRVDRDLQPLDEAGARRAEDLYACGSVLAGNDPARDGAGPGLSWCTGWLAGVAAAKNGGR